uniref:Uncharacterized protein n=1 Tax=Picea glauca TaxID=3330 RepID=A0A117NH25_PICGL|nr:hypothetical protein ABT39_MTgene5890 [Picea glauca]QHR92085.1 hypothetical protein Q903MT_gene6121 [Picea sitchensis]
MKISMPFYSTFKKVREVRRGHINNPLSVTGRALLLAVTPFPQTHLLKSKQKLRLGRISYYLIHPF